VSATAPHRMNSAAPPAYRDSHRMYMLCITTSAPTDATDVWALTTASSRQIVLQQQRH
jgi:hypothetical protein